jgi:hypothetical protein
MAVILSDPDGDVIPAGRFVHDRHCKRKYMTFSGPILGGRGLPTVAR